MKLRQSQKEELTFWAILVMILATPAFVLVVWGGLPMNAAEVEKRAKDAWAKKHEGIFRYLRLLGWDVPEPEVYFNETGEMYVFWEYGDRMAKLLLQNSRDGSGELVFICHLPNLPQVYQANPDDELFVRLVKEVVKGQPK